MIILPAIDIQNGECVRLTKGDFETAERVAEDPIATALAFKEAGAEWIHMVDLDGAKNAQMMNRDVFISVARETELKIELGGGIRDAKTAAYYLDNGIERVILGSAAVKNPKLIAELVHEYGDRIIVGIDADGGQVKTEGWLDTSRVNFITLAREMMYIGVHHIIYTDISRDGTLTGPDLEGLKKLRDSARINVIASGGISRIEDIHALGALGLYGAICGKAIYRETLDLKEAITVAAGYPSVEVSFDDDPDAAEESGAADRESRPDRRLEQNRGGVKRDGANSSRGGASQRGGESNKRSGQGGDARRNDKPNSGNRSGGNNNNSRGGNGNGSGSPKQGGRPGQNGGRPAGRGNQPKAGGEARPGGQRPAAQKQNTQRPNGQKPGGPKSPGPRPEGARPNGQTDAAKQSDAKRRRPRRGSRGRGRGGNGGGGNGGAQNGAPKTPQSPQQGE